MKALPKRTSDWHAIAAAIDGAVRKRDGRLLKQAYEKWHFRDARRIVYERFSNDEARDKSLNQEFSHWARFLGAVEELGSAKGLWRIFSDINNEIDIFKHPTWGRNLHDTLSALAFDLRNTEEGARVLDVMRHCHLDLDLCLRSLKSFRPRDSVKETGGPFEGVGRVIAWHLGTVFFTEPSAFQRRCDDVTKCVFSLETTRRNLALHSILSLGHGTYGFNLKLLFADQPLSLATALAKLDRRDLNLESIVAAFKALEVQMAYFEKNLQFEQSAPDGLAEVAALLADNIRAYHERKTVPEDGTAFSSNLWEKMQDCIGRGCADQESWTALLEWSVRMSYSIIGRSAVRSIAGHLHGIENRIAAILRDEVSEDERLEAIRSEARFAVEMPLIIPGKAASISAETHLYSKLLNRLRALFGEGIVVARPERASAQIAAWNGAPSKVLAPLVEELVVNVRKHVARELLERHPVQVTTYCESDEVAGNELVVQISNPISSERAMHLQPLALQGSLDPKHANIYAQAIRTPEGTTGRVCGSIGFDQDHGVHLFVTELRLPAAPRT